MCSRSLVMRRVLALLLLTLFSFSQATSTTSTLIRPSKIMNGQQQCTNGHKLSFLNELRSKYADQPTFIQAVEEMALNLLPLFEDANLGAFYKRAFLALAEPERIISFRVPWEDDDGNIQYNRGWRVEFSRYDRHILIGIHVLSYSRTLR